MMSGADGGLQPGPPCGKVQAPVTAAGAVVGAARSAHKGRQAQARQQSQAQASRQEAMNSYYRGFGACMEGRGYVTR